MTGKNPILIGLFIAVVALVVVSVFMTQQPPSRDTRPVAVSSARTPITEEKTPEKESFSPTPAAPPTVQRPSESEPESDEDEPLYDRFAEGWVYTTIVGDVVELLFEDGAPRTYRLNHVFVTPQREKASIVEINLEKAIIIVEREADQKRVEVPKADPQTTGLVLYYPFEESGDEILDMSGKARNGLAHRAKPVREGKMGSARSFNGSDSYIQVPVEGLEFIGAVSVCLWIQGKGESDALSGEWARVIQLADPTGRKPGFGITTGENDGRLAGFYQVNYRYSEYVTRSADILQNNRWYHVAMVYDGGATVTLYLDGSPSNEPPPSAYREWRAGEGRNFSIGRQAGEDSRYFKGLIDEVMIFERALTAEEVQRIYQSQM